MMTKEEILQEIRRTAEANGGIPLGRERFYSETGIREHDWLGKYWVRWSAAVQEAGFSPNRLQVALDETLLLERYIGLTKELDHLPVEAELRLKGREDRTFPSSKTYRVRFGAKIDLIKRLIDYCKDHEEHQNVFLLCKEYIATVKDVPNDVGNKQEDVGFVYLLKSGRFYKIGRTNAIGRREYELGIQLPEQAKIIHTIRTDDPAGIEAYWHNRFNAKRKNGEWFDLTTDDVAAFRRRKFM